jgi:pyruvate dehydrogenase E2 component (dihydrolipoamide acetyltransferase)
VSGTETHVAADITMPRLSDSMEEATILQWLKQPGERIARGEPLVEVETDKATIVYEAELDGVLAEIVVQEGESATLGAVIARVGTGGAPAAAAAAPAAPAAGEPAAVDRPVEPAPAPPAVEPPPARPQGDRPRATPVARRLAAELGVSLTGVNGTGPGGRIVRSDVHRIAGSAAPAAAPAAAPPEPGRGAATEVRLTPTQRTIAQRMLESRSAIPEFTLEVEIGMDAAHDLRIELRRQTTPVPSYNDLVVKAAALALREFPRLNASYDEGRVLEYSRVNIGIAVATEDALLVPTIFDADRKSVFEIAAASRSLVERANARSLQVADLSDGTFTISNLGMFGVRRFTAVINPPQAAILAVGEVAQRPWIDPYGGIAARRTTDVSLSCDHRVVYGAEGARFLHRLRELLEDPTSLVEG